MRMKFVLKVTKSTNLGKHWLTTQYQKWSPNSIWILKILKESGSTLQQFRDLKNNRGLYSRLPNKRSGILFNFWAFFK